MNTSAKSKVMHATALYVVTTAAGLLYNHYKDGPKADTQAVLLLTLAITVTALATSMLVVRWFRHR